jgi:hypothetical protein
MRKTGILLLVLMFLLGNAARASAQSQYQAYAQLGTPDLKDFPSITALLDVFDTHGQFVSGLKPENLTMLEDGQSRPVDELRELPVGVQIVVAVNPGPSLLVRDSQGVSRYEDVVRALDNWANTLPADSQDDLSLVSTTGYP